MVLAVVGGATLLNASPVATALTTMTATVAHYRVEWALLRWTLITLLIAYWPSAVVMWAKRNAWSPTRLTQMLAMRWHLAASLIAFEWLVVQAGAVRLAGWLR